MLLKKQSYFRQCKFSSGMTVWRTCLEESSSSFSSRQAANKIKVYMEKNI